MKILATIIALALTSTTAMADRGHQRCMSEGEIATSIAVAAHVGLPLRGALEAVGPELYEVAIIVYRLMESGEFTALQIGITVYNNCRSTDA